MSTLIRAVFASLIAVFVVVGPVSAATTQALTVEQATQQGTISGTITGSTGGGLSGAQVTIDGSGQHVVTTTDSAGLFTANLPAGLYTVSISHSGYQTSSTDVALVAGQTVGASVALQPATLSNLSVIGRTTTSGTGQTARFNVSTTSQSSLSQAQILQRNTPDLANVLQQLPGITIPRATSNPNQSFIIRGLRYESKTLVDGHAVSSGTAGTFLTQFAQSSIFGGANVQKGVSFSPLSGEAGGGIVNLTTPDFTSKDGGYILGGLDSYNGTMYTALANFNLDNNKIQFVFGRTFSGYRGPSYGLNEIDYAGTAPAIGTFSIPTLNNGLAQYYQDFSNTYTLNAELAKMRVNFSSATSLSLEFLGLQGRWDPQGGAYGQYVGRFNVPYCLNAGVAQATPATCTATSTYNAPNAQQFAGSQQDAYAFYPGSDVRQNQPNFNAELRTTIGNDSIAFRPYTAAINRLIDGTQEANTPGNGGTWAEVTNSANCQVKYVGPTAAGAMGPCFAAGANPTVAYVNDPNTPHTFAAQGSSPLVCTATTPCFTTSDTNQTNGGAYSFSAPYTTLELDKLGGYTASYLHPFGNGNTIGLTFDHYYDDTQGYLNDASPLASGCQFTIGTILNTPGSAGYQPTCPLQYLRASPIGVPETFSSVSSGALVTELNLTKQLTLDFAGYFTHYLIDAQQQNPAATTAAMIATQRTGAAPIQLVPVQNSASHFDPHFGLVFRPTRDWAVRFTAGSSMNIPYAGLVSGFQTYAQSVASTTISLPNATLVPETVVTLDLGSDYRTPDGTVISGDVYNTVVHNPWVSTRVIVSQDRNYINGQLGLEGSILYQSQTLNGAEQFAQGIEGTIANEPRVGFGYSATLSMERLYYLHMSPALFPAGAPQLFYNGAQFVSNGSGNTSVPYAKGYSEVRYVDHRGSLLRFGADYEGSNNEYNVPAFWIFDAGAAIDTGFYGTRFGVSVENLFNTNWNAGLARGVEYQGIVPIAATATANGYSYSTNGNSAMVSPGPVTFRFTLSKRF